MLLMGYKLPQFRRKVLKNIVRRALVSWLKVILIIVLSVQIDLLCIRKVIWLPTRSKHVISLVMCNKGVVRYLVMMCKLVRMVKMMWNL
jgi:hypothetical protein